MLSPLQNDTYETARESNQIQVSEPKLQLKLLYLFVQALPLEGGRQDGHLRPGQEIGTPPTHVTGGGERGGRGGGWKTIVLLKGPS